jgi:hypothetical protein
MLPKHTTTLCCKYGPQQTNITHIIAVKWEQTRRFMNWRRMLVTNFIVKRIFCLCCGKKKEHCGDSINPLTPNDLQIRRAISPLKIKIPSKNMREKTTNTPIMHSVY